MTSGSVQLISASRPISLCICTEGWSTNPISSMLRRFSNAITDAHIGERCIARMRQGWQLSIRTGTISDACELPLILKVYSLTITCTDYLMPTGLCRLIQLILIMMHIFAPDRFSSRIKAKGENTCVLSPLPSLFSPLCHEDHWNTIIPLNSRGERSCCLWLHDPL